MELFNCKDKVGNTGGDASLGKGINAQKKVQKVVLRLIAKASGATHWW